MLSEPKTCDRVAEDGQTAQIDFFCLFVCLFLVGGCLARQNHLSRDMTKPTK